MEGLENLLGVARRPRLRIRDETYLDQTRYSRGFYYSYDFLAFREAVLLLADKVAARMRFLGADGRMALKMCEKTFNAQVRHTTYE